MGKLNLGGYKIRMNVNILKTRTLSVNTISSVFAMLGLLLVTLTPLSAAKEEKDETKGINNVMRWAIPIVDTLGLGGVFLLVVGSAVTGYLAFNGKVITLKQNMKYVAGIGAFISACTWITVLAGLVLSAIVSYNNAGIDRELGATLNKKESKK